MVFVQARQKGLLPIRHHYQYLSVIRLLGQRRVSQPFTFLYPNDKNFPDCQPLRCFCIIIGIYVSRYRTSSTHLCHDVEYYLTDAFAAEPLEMLPYSDLNEKAACATLTLSMLIFIERA